LEVVKKLVQGDYVAPLPKDANNLTSALYQAIVNNQTEIAKFLIEKRLDLDVQIPQDNFWTCLHK
jgi:hypothetical protein